MVTSNYGYDLGMGWTTCKQSIRVKVSVFAPTSHQKMTIVLWLVTNPHMADTIILSTRPTYYHYQ